MIPVSHGDSFIDACDAHDLRILGIEGFEIRKDGVMPRMDLIADFSDRKHETWHALRERCSLVARDFIRAAVKEGDVYLSFVLEEAPS